MTPATLDFLSELVRVRSGVILQAEKSYFAESRLAPLARREGLESVEALLTSLRRHWDEKLAAATVDAMAIADTSFFRDRAVFEHIGRVVLPTLAAARQDGVVRVWCAGCSTGQEAYSMAMLAVQVEEQAPNSTSSARTSLSARSRRLIRGFTLSSKCKGGCRSVSCCSISKRPARCGVRPKG